MKFETLTKEFCMDENNYGEGVIVGDPKKNMACGTLINYNPKNDKVTINFEHERVNGILFPSEGRYQHQRDACKLIVK